MRYRAMTFRKLAFILIPLILLFVAGALYLFINRTPNDSPRSDSNVSIRVEGYPAMLTPEIAVQQGLGILLVEVVDVPPARWTTTDGEEPPNFSQAGIPAEYFIFSPVEVRALRVYNGEIEQTQHLTLNYPGGKVGNKTIDFSEMFPTFRTGELAILLVTPARANDPGPPREWSAIQVFKVVEQDGQLVAMSDNQPDIPIPDFEARIEQRAANLETP